MFFDPASIFCNILRFVAISFILYWLNMRNQPRGFRVGWSEGFGNLP
jgi:hypothetical protein